MARQRTLNVKIRSKGGGFEARPTIDGRQKSIFRKTKQEVESELAKLYLSKTRQERGTTTLGEFIAIWNDREKARAEDPNVRSPKTYLGRKGLLATHVEPQLGHVRLSSIDRDLIRDWSERAEKRLKSAPARKGKGKGTRSLQAAYSALSACLSEAVDDGLLESNPCLQQGRRSIKPLHKKSDIEILIADELRKLWIAATASARAKYTAPLIYLASATGMRQGEILALKWEDVDLVAATIRVRRNLTKDVEGKALSKRPKTAAGTRTIGLPPYAVQVLKHWQATGRKSSLGLVFPNLRGKHLNATNFMAREFRPALLEAKVRPVTFHSLRHTHASQLISSGANLKAISARLGHENIQTTLDIYGHLMPGDDAVLAAVVEREYHSLIIP
jgi:integrase